MPKPALNTAISEAALQEVATPLPGRDAARDLGQAGSKDSLARLNAAMRELKAVAAQPMVQRAVDALNSEDFVQGATWALKALEHDQTNGFAWYLLGIARERAGDYTNSIKAYEAALQLLPEHAEVANDLGRLAYRMGMHEQAEKLFLHYVAHAPDRPEGLNNLASVVRDRGRRDEAIDLLKQGLAQKPDSAMLWNTLGTIMIEAADFENAAIFFTEAARLAPKFAKARYNLSQVKLNLGDVAGALADCELALKRKMTADDREMMRLARSNYLLGLGRVGEGWDEYEARLSPQFTDVTHFNIDRPKWRPRTDLSGKTFLVVGEQGLGDEVLFANVLPDVLERLGPDGRLRLCVERRLVPLFERSFPGTEVTRHSTHVWATRPLRSAPETDLASVDLWAPMGSLMREFRRSEDAFPKRERFLIPDPERVAHWKALLETAPPGPKVGILWKSLISKDARHRYFSPFERWKGVLKTPRVSFINLQYGDCEAEIAEAERELGVTIWQPPGIDLKLDLDDVTALCCAMDLVIGFSNATLNLGAAAGAPTWLISTPGAWTLLGSDRYPWYPQVRTFVTESLTDWTPVMTRVATDLADFAKAAER